MSEAEAYREPSGWSNGLTLDTDSGNLLVRKHGGRRVSSAPGSETLLADAGTVTG